MKKGYILAGAIALAGLTAKCGIDAIDSHFPNQVYSTNSVITNYVPEKTNQNLETKVQVINKPEIKKTYNLKNEPDKILLARMIFGEARDCSYKEKIAVAYTAINRNKYWNKNQDLTDVILDKWQYSCFWEDNLNKKILMNPGQYEPNEWRICLKAADDAIHNRYPSLNKKQTFYHMKNIHKPRSWTEVNKKINLGKTKHVFYRT